jgi:hypothetical protein
MDSPFTQHLNTNYVPSDEQLTAIREIISGGEEALNHIDQKIHGSMEGGMGELDFEELQALTKLREKQERVVDNHRALISVIKRIDDDILTTIFLEVLDQRVVETRRGDPYRLTISPKHPGVVLSHVCQRWRGVALSTKLLWRHLRVWVPIYPSSLDAQDTWRTKVAKLVEMTREWISRSGTRHLSVEINEWSSVLFSRDTARAFINDCSEFHEFVDVLCSSSARWKSLDMEIDFPQARFPNFPTMRLLSIPLHSTPMLTNVRLHCKVDQHRQYGLGLVPTATILSAPTLRSLELGCGVVFQDIVKMPVVWSTLEHLVFHGYAGDSRRKFNAVEALQLFSECPNLVTCHIPLQNGGDVPTSRAPISLPRLVELSLLLDRAHIPRGFAPFLILPYLRKLVFNGSGSYLPRDHEANGLVEFFERFGSTLEDVTFCYKSLSPSALHYALQHLPNVSSLGLLTNNTVVREELAAKLNNDFLVELSPTFNQANTRITRLPLCPRLEVFSFDAGGSTLAERALVNFIQARRREVIVEDGMEVARLREVDCGGYRFRDINPVQALRSQGIDVDSGDFSLKNWSS